MIQEFLSNESTYLWTWSIYSDKAPHSVYFGSTFTEWGAKRQLKRARKRIIKKIQKP